MNPIDATRQAVLERMQADPELQNIPCILDEKGDVETGIEKALATLGIGVIFELERGTLDYPSVGAYVVNLEPVFTVVENVLINRDPDNVSASGKTASDVITRLFEVFHPLKTAQPIYLTADDLNADWEFRQYLDKANHASTAKKIADGLKIF